MPVSKYLSVKKMAEAWNRAIANGLNIDPADMELSELETPPPVLNKDIQEQTQEVSEYSALEKVEARKIEGTPFRHLDNVDTKNLEESSELVDNNSDVDVEKDQVDLLEDVSKDSILDKEEEPEETFDTIEELLKNMEDVESFGTNKDESEDLEDPEKDLLEKPKEENKIGEENEAKEKLEKAIPIITELKKKPLEKVAQERDQLKEIKADLEAIGKNISSKAETEKCIHDIDELRNATDEDQLKLSKDIIEKLIELEITDRVMNMHLLKEKKAYLEKIEAEENDYNEQTKYLLRKIEELETNTLANLTNSKDQHEEGIEKIGILQQASDYIEDKSEKGKEFIEDKYAKIHNVLLRDGKLEDHALGLCHDTEERLRLAELGQYDKQQYLFQNKGNLIQELDDLLEKGGRRGLKSNTKNQIKLTKDKLLLWIMENPTLPTEDERFAKEMGWYKGKMGPIKEILVNEIDITARETVYDKEKMGEKSEYANLAKLIHKISKIEKETERENKLPSVVKEINKFRKDGDDVAQKLMPAVRKKFKLDKEGKSKSSFLKKFEVEDVEAFIHKFFNKRRDSAEDDPMRRVAKESVRGWDVTKKLIGPGVGDRFPIEKKEKFTHIALDHILEHLEEADDYVEKEMDLSKETSKEKWTPFKKDLEPLGSIRLDLEKGKYKE